MIDSGPTVAWPLVQVVTPMYYCITTVRVWCVEQSPTALLFRDSSVHTLRAVRKVRFPFSFDVVMETPARWRVPLTSVFHFYEMSARRKFLSLYLIRAAGMVVSLLTLFKCLLLDICCSGMWFCTLGACSRLGWSIAHNAAIMKPILNHLLTWVVLISILFRLILLLILPYISRKAHQSLHEHWGRLLIVKINMISLTLRVFSIWSSSHLKVHILISALVAWYIYMRQSLVLHL